LGTAEVLARVVQIRSLGPGEHGLARLVLETPLVARGGDRFVVRSFSPVTTIGGGVVLDPFPAPRPRLRQRRLAAGQLPIERLLVLAQEAGLAGLSTASLPTRLGLVPGPVPALGSRVGTLPSMRTRATCERAWPAAWWTPAGRCRRWRSWSESSRARRSGRCSRTWHARARPNRSTRSGTLRRRPWSPFAAVSRRRLPSSARRPPPRYGSGSGSRAST